MFKTAHFLLDIDIARVSRKGEGTRGGLGGSRTAV
jgi:hypothetical protein